VSDEADLAQVEFEYFLQSCLAKRYRDVKLLPSSICHYCEEQVKKSLLFCDKDCRDDWELLERSKRMNP